MMFLPLPLPLSAGLPLPLPLPLAMSGSIFFFLLHSRTSDQALSVIEV